MSAPRAATVSTLTHRDRAILRAVPGSAELVAGAEPDPRPTRRRGGGCRTAAHRGATTGMTI